MPLVSESASALLAGSMKPHLLERDEEGELKVQQVWHGTGKFPAHNIYEDRKVKHPSTNRDDHDDRIIHSSNHPFVTFGSLDQTARHASLS